MARNTIIYLFYLQTLLVGYGCVTEEKPGSAGQQLAQTHCGSCHQFPEPSLLDKKTWKESVLPQMALRMGIAPEQINDSKIQDAYYNLSEANLYPRPALLSVEDWQKIRAYYETLAPDSLSFAESSLTQNSHFKVHVPERMYPPAVTSVSFHEATQQMLVADLTQASLLTVNGSFTAEALLAQQKLISYIQELPSDNADEMHLLITYLGKDIRPEGPAAGEVVEVSLSQGKGPQYKKLDLQMLPRPTQVMYIDLIGDAQAELLTCNFGFLHGRLSYWTKDNNDKYQEHIIRDEAGALKAVAQDFTRDGRTDLMVLWGQGDERITLYKNLGDGSFEEEVLLRFPPSYGSSYFELSDINADGLPDIVYTCGDNADHSPVLKPYHGIYIFQNQGDRQYEQSYFFPMHGAYKAIARDFDLDGDMDIAVVAFFADYANQPDKGFVFLEQQDSFQFQASTVPVHELGRWITLDAGDLDQDGDLDIVLGNCSTAGGFDRTLDRQWKEGPPYVVLENTIHPR